MREILFRGKRLDNGEWVEGFYVCLNGIEHMIYNGYAETDCGEFYPDYFQVDPETVCQFTGLTDKDGTKIFKGDVVKSYDMCGTYDGKGMVHWSDLFLSWEFGKCKILLKLYKYEVIGNIFDNPELMEGGAE